MLTRRSKQTTIRCTCLLLAGTALQLSVGAIDPSFLAHPWGLIAAANYLYLLIFLALNKEKYRWTEWLCSRDAYISSIASMLVLTLLFGLIRQDGNPVGVVGFLGFTQMKNSWIFNIFLFQLMTVLGMRVVEEIRNFQKRRLPITVIHLSFFLILAAAIFGSGDKMRVTVTSVQGEPTNRAVMKDGRVVALPFTSRLKKFTMEEYPPHIHLYSADNLTKEYVAIEKKGDEGKIGIWQVECTEYIEMAGKKPDEAHYLSMNHVGATTAVYLKATDGRHSVEGWVSCGSHIFPATTLQLPDSAMLVMPPREAKKYLSQMEVDENGDKRGIEISVNHPATVGSWKIYQSAYDRTRGKWSTVTVLECVKDGWYPVVEIAMWVSMVVGVLMFVFGNRQRKEEEKQ